MTAFGVVIPAYHGVASLHRSMRSLAAQRYDGELNVVVAVNDGRHDTLAAAHALAPGLRATGARCTVLRTSRGRGNAFAAAERELPDGPRLYLDQDAAVSPGAVAALADVLAEGSGVHFAAPTLRVAPATTAVSRAFYRVWADLPYVRDSPVTIGAYAVSAAGRRRWAAFPPLHSDDKWVRLHFAQDERRVVPDGWYEVTVPDGVRELVRARRRYLRGNLELRHGQHQPPGVDDKRYRGLLRTLLRDPAALPAAGAFLGVYGAAVVTECCARLWPGRWAD